MPSVLVEVPFKKMADLYGLDPNDFRKEYEEIKKDILSETRREFDNYRVRAGVANKKFISTIYLLDINMDIKVMIPDDLPSTSAKKIITLSKMGTPTVVVAPISSDKVWVSDGITRNTFLTRIESKYSIKAMNLFVAEKLRRIYEGR